MSVKIPVNKRLNIHLIGSGGTGGYALACLCRLLAGGDHTIHVYDGDRVETKNLKRQNFRVEDLDLNKAQVLCDRYAKEIFGCPKLIPHPDYLTGKEDLLAEILTSLETGESLIILLAVDNIATRRMVNDLVENDLLGLGIPVIALDSGNDNQGGQVILYANAPVIHQEPMGQPEQGMLPTMLQYFPELDKIVDDNPGLVMNCADNAESEPQAMMANVRNGELLALITNRLLEAGSVPGNLWRSDILTGNTRCTFTGFYHKEESSNG